MLVNWLLYPLILAAASAGHGFVVRRICGGPSAVLVVPTGFASVVVLCTVTMRVSSLHALAWLAIVGPAVLGWVLVRREVGPALRRRGGATGPAIAALGAFAAYAAPVVLSGHLTFTGYSLILDIAHHLDLASWLQAHGTAQPAALTSSYTQIASGLLYSNYPIGFHSLLAGGGELLGREIAWLYQPTVAFAGPMAALAAYAILGGFGAPRWLRTVGALVAAQPTLLYSYSLEAGFKELYGFAFVVLLAALLGEAWRGGVRRLLPAVLPVLAAYLVFNLTIAPWLAAVVGVFALARVLRYVQRLGWPPMWRRIHPATIAFAVFVVAVAIYALHRAEGETVPGIVTAQNELGNLGGPLSEWTAGGVWLTGDYRFPLVNHIELNFAFLGAVILLALFGVVHLVARRRTEGLALLAALLGTLLFFVPVTGPWLDAKAYAMDGGLVLLLAFAGLAALRWSWTPVAAWIGAAAVAAGVLYGNALAYQNTVLAPPARYAALERIAQRYAGKGPALAPSFDEYAEYFLRTMDATGRVDPFQGNMPGAALFGADIGQIAPTFVETFPTLVLRRGAERPRPPFNFRLDHRDRFYDVWRRVGPPTTLLAHDLLAAPPRHRADCVALARRLQHTPGATGLVWSTAPSPFVVDPLGISHSPQWTTDGVRGLLTVGAGRADGTPRFSTGGRYEVWVKGSFGRPVHFQVDDHEIGVLSDEADYPNEEHLLGHVDLTAGRHHVSFTMGGGSIRPGNGNASRTRAVTALFFATPRLAGNRLFRTPLAAARRVCERDQALSWVEAVGPGSGA